MAEQELSTKLALLTEILSNIEKKVLVLESNDREIMQKIDDLKGNKIAGLETQIALLQERVALLQRISYSAIGVVLLGVIGALAKLVILQYRCVPPAVGRPEPETNGLERTLQT